MTCSSFLANRHAHEALALPRQEPKYQLPVGERGKQVDVGLEVGGGAQSMADTLQKAGGLRHHGDPGRDITEILSTLF